MATVVAYNLMTVQKDDLNQTGQLESKLFTIKWRVPGDNLHVKKPRRVSRFRFSVSAYFYGKKVGNFILMLYLILARNPPTQAYWTSSSKQGTIIFKLKSTGSTVFYLSNSYSSRCVLSMA